ncbi:hypothetical protein B0H19DRAFT_657360 [Mycena capillaripes]|nr:hypothetical protein B0H19DRAFT_657360 [Mycena capillaripes]
MAAFEVSNSRGGPSYLPEFEIDAAMDPRYCFPPQTDAKTGLIPFSPSYSPISLHPGLDNTSGVDSPMPENGVYWMDHPDSQVYGDGALLHSHSPQWSGMPSPSPELWSAMMMPSTFEVPDALPPFSTYNFPSRSSLPHILPRPSSPASDSSGRLSPISVFTSSAASSRRSSIDTSAPGLKRCSHCAATTTPLWRRNPVNRQPLCNACGLYLQQRNKLRPLALIAADREDDIKADAESASGALGDADGPECSHCHARKTSVWRRSKTGARLCNACGVYVRLRGRDRPLTLKRNKIKPRCKHAKSK